MKLYGICREKGQCVCKLCAEIERPDPRAQQRSRAAGQKSRRNMTITELNDYLELHGEPPKKYYVELGDIEIV